ncbi:MerR family transcriptional regulator [Baekduia soli]|uniref:MerR family transcriptional regulator n=1 Tax=Baekduia soli TaxID=496014 RepID=UPI001651C42B|nr:MerR family transcriptional regulator [Baekduia soli]
MSPAQAAAAGGLRIGEVARLVGTTPRTIRYYEELGLLARDHPREAGRHRLYGEQDVERLREALRLKELLGISLEELRELVEAQDARAALRDEWHHGNPGAARRREILDQSLGHVERQLDLLAGRRAEIERLEDELRERRELIRARLADG